MTAPHTYITTTIPYVNARPHLGFALDYRQATSALWRIVNEANRYINQVRPWDLAKAERGGDHQAATGLDSVLATLIRACRIVGAELAPFLPGTAAGVTRQCAAIDGRLPSPSPVFHRLVSPHASTTPQSGKAESASKAAS